MRASMIDQVGRTVTMHNALAADRAVEGQGVSSELLLQEMGCARKALYGCAEELRGLGAPVEYERKKHVWSYGQAWNFPWQVLHTLTGPSALRLTMAMLLDPELEPVLEDLVAVDPDLPRRGNATLPRMTGLVERGVLGRISTAMRERRKIRFLYQKPSEKAPEWREVEPLSIFEWDGMPYLQARDPDEPLHPFKRFALSRLSRPEVLEERFLPPLPARIPTSLGAFTGKPFRAVFRAEPHLVPYVQERQWHRDQKTRLLEDGAILFELPFVDHEDAARWILGRGPGYAPLGPEPLVRIWRRMVSELGRSARQAVRG